MFGRTNSQERRDWPPARICRIRPRGERLQPCAQRTVLTSCKRSAQRRKARRREGWKPEGARPAGVWPGLTRSATARPEAARRRDTHIRFPGERNNAATLVNCNAQSKCAASSHEHRQGDGQAAAAPRFTILQSWVGMATPCSLAISSARVQSPRLIAIFWSIPVIARVLRSLPLTRAPCCPPLVMFS